jgi:hypothetical protein
MPNIATGEKTMKILETAYSKSNILKSLALSAFVALAAVLQPAQADLVINVDINAGHVNYNYTGKGAIVDPGTTWNYYTGSALTDLTASDGTTPTTVDFSINPSGFNAASQLNHLQASYAYTLANQTGTWTLGGLSIGQSYDLYFYSNGSLDATYAVTGGINDGPVSASIDAAWLGTNTPEHSDWTEGVHYAFLQVTPNAGSGGTISGTFTSLVAGNQSTFSGLQITETIPEPSTLVLFGVGLTLLLRHRKRRG